MEPLGCVVLLAPPLAAPDELVSLEELELLGEVVAPPEDVPLLSLSLSASVAAVLDELDDGLVAEGLVALEDEELGELGLVALGELELELEPALGELGGVDGVDDALLLEPLAPGALEVFPGSFLSPQAASPRASATAIANVESLMCSSKVGYKKRGEQGSDRV